MQFVQAESRRVANWPVVGAFTLSFTLDGQRNHDSICAAFESRASENCSLVLYTAQLVEISCQNGVVGRIHFA